MNIVSFLIICYTSIFKLPVACNHKHQLVDKSPEFKISTKISFCLVIAVLSVLPNIVKGVGEAFKTHADAIVYLTTILNAPKDQDCMTVWLYDCMTI